MNRFENVSVDLIFLIHSFLDSSDVLSQFRLCKPLKSIFDNNLKKHRHGIILMKVEARDLIVDFKDFLVIFKETKQKEELNAKKYQEQASYLTSIAMGYHDMIVHHDSLAVRKFCFGRRINDDNSYNKSMLCEKAEQDALVILQNRLEDERSCNLNINTWTQQLQQKRKEITKLKKFYKSYAVLRSCFPCLITFYRSFSFLESLKKQSSPIKSGSISFEASERIKRWLSVYQKNDESVVIQDLEEYNNLISDDDLTNNRVGLFYPHPDRNDIDLHLCFIHFNFLLFHFSEEEAYEEELISAADRKEFEEEEKQCICDLNEYVIPQKVWERYSKEQSTSTIFTGKMMYVGTIHAMDYLQVELLTRGKIAEHWENNSFFLLWFDD
jgi:hypothetical protein